MTEILKEPIASLGEFLVHALELEVESAERYREMADSMEVHNNLEVAELFQQMAVYGDEHANEVRERTAGMALPEVAPWDFKWSCPDAPEAICMEQMSYLMTKCQALQIALHNEQRGRDFYAQVAETTPSTEVAQVAVEMAEEESGHVEMLKAWMAREACELVPHQADLDPPNMPE